MYFQAEMQSLLPRYALQEDNALIYDTSPRGTPARSQHLPHVLDGVHCGRGHQDCSADPDVMDMARVDS